MAQAQFLKKVEKVEERYKEVEALLSDPEVTSDIKRLMSLSKELSDLKPLIAKLSEYKTAESELEEAFEMAKDSDPEMQDLAQDEIKRIQALLPQLESDMKLMLLPKDPLDEKNIILEIRAGTGGEEAALFAADLFRMYSHFAENKKWKVEIMSSSDSGAGGGFKEIIAMIKGKEVYSWLKYESGVHRVQRVPNTESQGRVHTSAATVAILPEAEDIELKIEDKDLKIDVMRAGGPGGQSVNTTDSAVRIHHIPSGMIVICQDEKSQHKNKAKALRIMKARLFELERAKQAEERRDERRSMVGSGDRSEKIRTYNYPQDRLTDHRINFTRHNLGGALDGDLDDVILNLRAHNQAELLQSGLDERA